MVRSNNGTWKENIPMTGVADEKIVFPAGEPPVVSNSWWPCPWISALGVAVASVADACPPCADASGVRVRCRLVTIS